MKNIETVARTIMTERDYIKMPKDVQKRHVLRVVMDEMEKMITENDISVQYIPDGERGPSFMLSLPFRLIVGESEIKFNLGPAARMTEKDILKYSNGNPGALMILTMEVRGNDRIAEAIKYHDLRGDKLYVIFNDCCGRDVDLFDRRLGS